MHNGNPKVSVIELLTQIRQAKPPQTLALPPHHPRHPHPHPNTRTPLSIHQRRLVMEIPTSRKPVHRNRARLRFER